MPSTFIPIKMSTSLIPKNIDKIPAQNLTPLIFWYVVTILWQKEAEKACRAFFNDHFATPFRKFHPGLKAWMKLIVIKMRPKFY